MDREPVALACAALSAIASGIPVAGMALHSSGSSGNGASPARQRGAVSESALPSILAGMAGAAAPLLAELDALGIAPPDRRASPQECCGVALVALTMQLPQVVRSATAVARQYEIIGCSALQEKIWHDLSLGGLLTCKL